MIKYCKVCGKEINVAKDIVTCENCRGTVLKQRTFGVRKCVWCGKEFIAMSPKQNSCKDKHYRPCIDCGVPLLIKESYANYMKAGGRRCEDCRRKAIKTSWNNFSEDKLNDIKEHTKQTNLEKYGTEFAASSDEVKQLRIAGVQKRYGVDNPGQSPIIRAKVDNTVNERYGGYTLSSKILRQAVKHTMKAKYGTEHPTQVPSIRNKTVQNNLSRYGVANPAQCECIKSKMRKTYTYNFGKVLGDKYGQEIQTNYIQFKSNPIEFITSHYSHKPTVQEIYNDIRIDMTTIHEILHRFGCEELVTYHVSNMGQEVIQYIQSIDPNITILHNDRSIIYPKEIDIYLPQFKIGVECNPTYTHNSSIPSYDDKYPTPSNYHKLKTDLCKEAGIFLFHIFGYEWEHKQDIIKSMLRNMLGKNNNKMFARNLRIHEIDSKTANAFLANNHRQGPVTSTIRLGLFTDNGKLVSVMTFGRLRPSMGKQQNDENVWELSRFCTELGSNVVGGASKLFKAFLKLYPCTRIVSFSDRAHTRGTLYEKLGFKYVHTTQPSYVWVNYVSDTYYHRSTCQKSNLRRLFADNTIDIDHNTERQIMIDHGYVQVFDSGLIKWEYELNSL
jgi:hypothetical protein